MTDTVDRATRSRIMSKIRSRDTGPERRFLESHRVKAYQPRLPYRPDFVDGNGRIVYVETRFWHGDLPAAKYAKLPAWWRRKLLRNITRDIVADLFWHAAGVRHDRILMA
jgi:DNA mismatch endonuclease (patch repair protein)